jgi:hypothetical protein
VQDPNQLTKHGKSKIASLVYALNSFEESSSGTSSPTSTSSSLAFRISTQRKAETGSSTFQTLAPVSGAKTRSSKKAVAQRRKALSAYLHQLRFESSISAVKPLSAESTLIARWIDMLGSVPANSMPLSILGTFILSIPSRVGSNPMLDLAVEFLVDSHAVFWNDSYSKRQAAGATKSRALKELQLAVSQDCTRKTYEMVLATKMHYAAEVRVRDIAQVYHKLTVIVTPGHRHNVPRHSCFRTFRATEGRSCC